MRALFSDVVRSIDGAPIPNVTVDVFEPETTVHIAETIYSGYSGASVLTNPFTTDSQGRVKFYLTDAKTVSVRYTKTGFISETQIVPVVLPTANAELAIARYELSTALTFTGTGFVDVTGLSITFTVADRPVKVEAFLPVCSMSIASVGGLLHITDESDVQKGRGIGHSAAANNGFPLRAYERIEVPGTYTRKARCAVASGAGNVLTVFGRTAGTVEVIPYIEAIQR